MFQKNTGANHWASRFGLGLVKICNDSGVGTLWPEFVCHTLALGQSKIFLHCTSLTIPRFGSCDVKTTSAHSERHYPKDLILHLQGGDFKQPSIFVYSSKATEFFWNSRRLEHGAWTTISANECIDNEVVHLVL